MLIDFTVENFRSFSDAQTFSMIVANDSSHKESVTEKGDFRLLKAAALYGANASGKSNLVKAIGFMQRFVRESATKMNLGDPIMGIEPFRLDRQWRTKPSSFAIRLLVRGTEYQYGFSATQERVHREWLHVKREDGRVSQVLVREYVTTTDTTQWHLRGELKEQAQAAVKATRDNGLFLSQAAQMNVDFVAVLFLWFRDRIWNFDLSTLPLPMIQVTARRVLEDPAFRSQMERLIRDADLGISQLVVQKRKLPNVSLSGIPGASSRIPYAEYHEVQTYHHSPDSNEPVEFSLEQDESLGTQRFFSMLGPIVAGLELGALLVVDEFDCSMHPLLTQKLVELFQSNEANPNGAQLVFATHDSSLMCPSLLRRDQVWFSEKNEKAATQLFSLFDIERTPRKREAFEKNYLAGRYGAVPSFGPTLEDFELR